MLKKYLKDTGGQFAIMFGLATTAIIIGVGAAVDMTGMSHHSTYLQGLTDAGALAAVASGDEEISKLREHANKHIDSNEDSGSGVKVKVELDGDILRVTGSSEYKTKFMSIVGKKSLPVQTVSEAPIGQGIAANVAMVLDRTGSMNGDNMTALKDAAGSLVDTIEGFNTEVRVSVVPFSDYVNVGLANRNAPWMDVAPDSTGLTQSSCYMKRDIVNPGLCKTTKILKTCYSDGVPSDCTETKQTCPDAAYGPEYETCSDYTPTEKWHGCAGSRTDPLHMDPGFNGNRIPGVMNQTCGEELLPLTTNMMQVDKALNNLTASGNTYVPAGLIWGWRTLHEDRPFNDVSNADKDVKKIMILMTDGQNTLGYGSPKHNWIDMAGTDAKTKQGETDDLMLKLCTSIKKEGIELYTVAYKFHSSAKTSKGMIKKCASTKNMFFDAQNSTDLKRAFESIGKSLLNVRLSK